MKFRVIDRISIVVYGLLGACLSVVLGYAAYAIYLGNLKLGGNLIEYRIRDNAWMLATVLFISALLLLYSIGMIRLAFRRERRKDRASVSVQSTSAGNGEVRISMQALDSLVKQAIAGHEDEVADIKTKIINHDDSISVCVDMALKCGTHIPNVTTVLQNSVKNFIEEFSGIAVRDVSIMISTIIPVEPEMKLEQPKPTELIEEVPTQQVLPESEPLHEPEIESAREPEREPAEEAITNDNTESEQGQEYADEENV